MSWKAWLLAAAVALAFAFVEDPSDVIAAAAGFGLLVLSVRAGGRAARGVVRSSPRPVMIASGLVMATILVLPMVASSRILEASLLVQLVFLPAYVLAGLIFGVSYALVLLPAGDRPVVQSAGAVVFVGCYWLVTTVILAKAITVLRRLTAGRVQAPE